MAPRSRKPGSAIVFDLDVTAVTGLQNVLRAMPTTLRNQVVMPIVTKLADMGAKMAKRNLKSVLPKRNPRTRRWDRPTGLLADSLGSKVVPLSKMRNKNIVYGAFGARSDFRVSRPSSKNVANMRRRIGNTQAGAIAVGRLRDQSGRIIAGGGSLKPSKYIHLVEKGHRPVPAYNIPAARPYPFIEPARTELRGQMPAVVRSLFDHHYRLAVGRMTRRYLRRIERSNNAAPGKGVT